MALHGRKWSHVAKLVPGRTDVQCRERYMNCLNPGGWQAGWGLGAVGCPLLVGSWGLVTLPLCAQLKRPVRLSKCPTRPRCALLQAVDAGRGRAAAGAVQAAHAGGALGACCTA